MSQTPAGGHTMMDGQPFKQEIMANRKAKFM